ncbi:hypothetical protein ACQR1I_11725 [Bradyrhizobium sp. HKCCYLS2038]|uniref:hypothetical protein n=1 Tax=unclassified Bradyrhizobium TaxID=2631580 RepID=UPI003EBD9F83
MFKNKKFDVEHALNLYADSFSLLPAHAIYDEEALKPFMPVIERCHIYFVGLVPKVHLLDAKQTGRTLIISMGMAGKTYDLDWELPDGFDLKTEGDIWYVLGENGTRSFPADEEVSRRLALTDAPMHFDVQYIGQAYGSEGSRNALDRLRKHETLQKISLQGVPDGYRLELLLFEVVPAHARHNFLQPEG